MAGNFQLTHQMNKTLIPDKKATATQIIRDLAEKNGGILTAETVLDEATSKRSPLHPFFCWDNTKAAHEFRRIQAAELIRRVKVTYHPTAETSVRVRAFVNVLEPAPEGEAAQDDLSGPQRGIYVGFEEALRVDSYRDQMVRQCKRDVETFQGKYSAISEAAQIIDAMNAFTSTFSIE